MKKMTEEQALASGIKRRVSSGSPDFIGDIHGECRTCWYEYSHDGNTWTDDWEEAYELLKK